MADTSPQALAKQLLTILYNDRDELNRIDGLIRGNHPDPYMPDLADAEYRLLAQRAVTNLYPVAIGTPAQALYVDSFRRRRRPSPTPLAARAATETATPEMEHWQRSRLDARQMPLHRGAIGYGHAFTVTEKNARGKSVTKCLSPLRTSALFEDPANDIVPYAMLSVATFPKGDVFGTATLWTTKYRIPVSFKDVGTDDVKIRVGDATKHGASECPGTRFTAYVDLDGRTSGVVALLENIQNRLNQTIFDLLVAQTGGSFKVRTVSGMAPPLKMKPVYDNPLDPSEVTDMVPELDHHGNPIPAPVNLNARKFLFAEDHEVKFGQLDETPLNGYIDSIDMTLRHISIVGQIPPHHILGQIANLSAEALQAAETTLLRMVEEFRKSFGESWERVFRLAAELDGEKVDPDDWGGEVIWRDMEQKSIAQAADALGKLKESLDIPARGLWSRVPNVTSAEMEEWGHLQDSQPIATLSDAISGSGAIQRQSRASAIPDPIPTPA